MSVLRDIHPKPMKNTYENLMNLNLVRRPKMPNKRKVLFVELKDPKLYTQFKAAVAIKGETVKGAIQWFMQVYVDRNLPKKEKE